MAERAAGQRDLESEFFQLGKDKDFKAVGELEEIVETEDELEE